MLLYREWIVGAALDGRIIRDDQHIAAGDAADAGHHSGAGRIAVVHAPRGQRRELEERRARIDQPLDAFAHRHLALLAMPREIFRAAALPYFVKARAIFAHERLHALAIGAEVRAVGVDV